VLGCWEVVGGVCYYREMEAEVRLPDGFKVGGGFRFGGLWVVWVNFRWEFGGWWF